MQAGLKRRRYPRVPLSADAPVVLLRTALIVDGSRRADAYIINLAEAGLFLKTDESIGRGRAVQLRLVTCEDRVCVANGCVVWNADIGIGVRLVQASQEFLYFVRELAAVGIDERQVLLRSVRFPQLRVH